MKSAVTFHCQIKKMLLHVFILRFPCGIFYYGLLVRCSLCYSIYAEEICTEECKFISAIIGLYKVPHYVIII